MLALIAIQSMLLAQSAQGTETWPPQPWVLARPQGAEGRHPLCSSNVVSDPAADAYAAGGRELPALPEIPERASGLRLDARASARRARIGSKVDLRLAIINDTPEVVWVSTGADFRARVADRRGVIVWTYPPAEVDGIMVGIPAIGCCRRVLPAEPLEYGLTWDLTDEKGHTVPPGEYVVFLAVSVTPELSAAPFRITVEPRKKP